MKGALLAAAAGIYGMLAFLGLVGGTVGLRHAFVLRLSATRKQKYQLNLTESLYYKILTTTPACCSACWTRPKSKKIAKRFWRTFSLAQSGGQRLERQGELDHSIEAFLEPHAARRSRL